MTATITVTAKKSDPVKTTSKGYKLIEESGDNIIQGAAHPFPVPAKFESIYHHRKHILEHMAGAFRVFARRNYGEGAAGHISVRDPEDPSTFWINPYNIHFGLIRAQDLVRVDEHGNVIGGNRAAVNAAGFKIHSQLHKARSDINAACHAHSIHGKAWSAFGKELEMLNQDACAFHEIQAVYHDFGGVVLEEEEGRKLAEALGDSKKVIILQNHGLLTTGLNVDEAAYKFTLMENTCQVQLLVDSNKNFTKKIIDDETANYTRISAYDPETMYGDFQCDYMMEIKLSNGDFLFPEDYDITQIFWKTLILDPEGRIYCIIVAKKVVALAIAIYFGLEITKTPTLFVQPYL